MTKLYRANVKSMYVKKLHFSGEAISLVETDSHVLYSDALFYEGRMGKIISFDYGTILPNAEEAYYYVEHCSLNHPDHLECATCPYVDDRDFRYERSVDRKEFKGLKKIFKQRKGY